MTAVFGIFAFIVINIETINAFQAFACVLGIIIVAVFLWILVRHLLKNLKTIKENEMMGLALAIFAILAFCGMALYVINAIDSLESAE